MKSVILSSYQKLKSIRILMVDDDEDDFILVEDYLNEAYGDKAEVVWVDQYQAALDKLDNQNFDVILVDYMLGEKNGLELIKSITADTFSINAVILLTGLDNHEVDVAATESGAMDYLVKQELSSSMLERSIRYALNRKHIEEQLIALAQHDPLTGLANRAKFNLALETKIAEMRRDAQPFAVFLLDLDNFKEVNDTLGHSSGDGLLKSTSKRILEAVRDNDMVARLGGDEFAIIAGFDDVAEGSANIAERLNHDLTRQVVINENTIHSGVSIGIALYPHDGTTPETLLKSADLAMYKAKRGGRNTYRYFDPEFEREMTQNKRFNDELKRAISEQQFQLYYQPIINTRKNKIVKAEALIRWHHPTMGLVSPDHFIPIAERSKLIVPIGLWVMEQAVKDCELWQQNELLSHVGVAINLSPVQFRDRGLKNLLENTFGSSQVKASDVTLEITETTLMEKQQDLLDRLYDLTALDFDLAIDDFGTGYSSLSYLKQFPVSTLKVDRSFVSDIGEDPDDEIITQAIINLGHSLNRKVIAEGIENQKQLDVVNKMGCYLIQGYFYTKPLPLRDFINWSQSFLNE